MTAAAWASREAAWGTTGERRCCAAAEPEADRERRVRSEAGGVLVRSGASGDFQTQTHPPAVAWLVHPVYAAAPPPPTTAFSGGHVRTGGQRRESEPGNFSHQELLLFAVVSAGTV